MKSVASLALWVGVFSGLICCSAYGAEAGEGAKRVVIVKVDGLPEALLEKQLQAGTLPWIDRVFRKNGTWVKNFYVRGISLSAPSWSMLDTGQHLAIRGNAEFDRSYARVYDYLNFFPFYVDYARLQRADMPGVEVLDQSGVPLFLDRFAPDERSQSAQLYQRGVRWNTLKNSLTNRIARPIKELISEWETGGLAFSEGISKQQEKELLNALADPKIHYLDFFFGDYDHVAHLTNDPMSQTLVLRHLDALIGQIWTAIEGSPLARQTVLVMVSDHGMNSVPRIYSQGYNLVRYFNSAAGGGHHVVTTRHPMTEYKLRGLDPFVSYVTTASDDSKYLRGHEDYPTALIDLDGNERASIQLRNSDWNALQILFERKDMARVEKDALISAIIERHRAQWTQIADELKEELGALHRAIESQKDVIAKEPKTKDPKPKDPKAMDGPRRVSSLDVWQRDEQGYSAYAKTLERLIAWKAGDAAIAIPKGVMGDRNTIGDLRSYAVGPTQNGLERMDYLRALTAIRVNNAVQKELGTSPVDFVAVRVADDQVLLYKGEEREAVLSWQERDGKLWLRYRPVAGVWRSGLPLELFEDANLCVEGDRTAWLNDWHSEAEWFRAVYATRYSNAVIGLSEHFRRWKPAEVPALFRVTEGRDWNLLQRFAERKRRNAEADLLLMASDHWNFNVRGFNPGGNHGSFLQTSTHSVLMLAGAGVPAGNIVERPYDSLNFVPTLLSLMHGLESSQLPGEPIL